MRNPKRISKVMRELEVLWNQRPDWRLGQLIFNIVGRDPFHIEDYDLVEQGFKKFGGPTPMINDFPDYWVEPNGMKDFVNSLRPTNTVSMEPEPAKDKEYETKW